MNQQATAAQKSPAVTITIPTLNEGEHYAGIALKDGTPSHHLILLPGDLDDTTWAKAEAWAKEQGGELPTRQEQALLFANAKQQFKSDWYWSCETHASYSDYAWLQGFGGGYQSNDPKGFSGRARAVRRLPI